ncbi:MAG: hypothetical protein OXR73_28755 [Myxococcales bacterium]|nr:hypothetical protein [Myxococcales bacterium]
MTTRTAAGHRLFRTTGTLGFALGLALSHPVLAQGPEERGASVHEGPMGLFDAQAFPVQARVLASRRDIQFEGPQEPIFRADRAEHVANGVALRDRTRGFIHSRGVPPGSQVIRSYLFWNYSDGVREAPGVASVLFDGNLVVGSKTADNTDPCWGKAGNHSFVADVTAFTTQAGGTNQDYEVVVVFDGKTSTLGQNPWAPQLLSDVLLEGATLVVVYRNRATHGQLYLFAPPGDNMFYGSAIYMLPSPGIGRALFTAFGADGQRGAGHDNDPLASNEITLVNASQVAGPAVAASDWDGSDGWPLPQLWDTHTHVVEIREQVSRVEYNSAGGDCLVPVGFVLDLQ